jgi:hypothetical protein
MRLQAARQDADVTEKLQCCKLVWIVLLAAQTYQGEGHFVQLLKRSKLAGCAGVEVDGQVMLQHPQPLP